MNYSKKTWQQKLASALNTRRIKFTLYSSMISTEHGDLIFSEKSLSIRYPGSAGNNAVFRYSGLETGQVLQMLTQPHSASKTEDKTRRKESVAMWLWALIGGVLVAGCTTFAATKLDFGAELPKMAQEQGRRYAGMFGLKAEQTERAAAIENGTMADLFIETDLESTKSHMDKFANLSDQNKRIQYKFSAGTWINENLEHISKLSRHHIVYDTKTNFRINSQIIETGRGSELVKKAYYAINAEFDGALKLVQCKNTSIITDKTDYNTLCS